MNRQAGTKLSKTIHVQLGPVSSSLQQGGGWLSMNKLVCLYRFEPTPALTVITIRLLLHLHQQKTYKRLDLRLKKHTLAIFKNKTLIRD